MRRIASLSLLMLIAGCLTAGPGGCSAEEAAAFNGIDHFGEQALVPEDHPYGICGAVFSTDVDPDAVVEHYQTALAEAGWTVQDPESFPLAAEGGGQIGTSINLTGSNGSMTFSLGAELLDDSESPTFNVLVGESGS